MLCRTPRVVSDDDLKWLIQNLEERNEAAEMWEHVIHKTNNRISYSAKRCKPTVIINTKLNSFFFFLLGFSDLPSITLTPLLLFVVLVRMVVR